jgi:hypothetical protein
MDNGFLRVDVVFTAGSTALPGEKRERGQGREMFMSGRQVVVECRTRRQDVN